MIRSFLKRWAPVLLWCALIFGASADKSSGQRSSRIIAPLVRFFVPKISEDTLDDIVHYVRKTAHVTEYAVLALLLWHALSKARSRRTDDADAQRNRRREEADLKVGRDSVEPSPDVPKQSTWSWRIAALAFALASFYAMTDEFHQSFVPTRGAQVRDVFIDSFGAALGLFALWFVGRWRKHW